MNSMNFEHSFRLSTLSVPPFEVCLVNKAKIVVLTKPIKNKINFNIKAEGCTLILLEPINVENNITIKATNVLAMATLNTEKGNIDIFAKDKLMRVNVFFEEIDKFNINSKSNFFYTILPEKLEFIKQLFDTGFNYKDEHSIVRGFIHIFDALVDPFSEKEYIQVDGTYQLFEMEKIIKPVMA